MKLNRQGLSDMLRDCLKTDTATLYGSGKLLQGIYSDPVKFSKAKTNKTSPYKLYIWAANATLPVDQMQCSYDPYVLNLKFEANGNITNIKTAVDNIDLAVEQVKELIRVQVFGGLMFQDYYTDTNGDTLQSAVIAGGDLEEPETDENNNTIIECINSIEALVRRVR